MYKIKFYTHYSVKTYTKSEISIAQKDLKSLHDIFGSNSANIVKIKKEKNNE